MTFLLARSFSTIIFSSTFLMILSVHDLVLPLSELCFHLSSSICYYWQVRWTTVRGQHPLVLTNLLSAHGPWRGPRRASLNPFLVASCMVRLHCLKMNMKSALVLFVNRLKLSTIYFLSASMRRPMISLRAQWLLSPAFSLFFRGPPGDSVATLLIYKLVEAYINQFHTSFRPTLRFGSPPQLVP